jgi:hypothetical protein
MKIQTSDGKVVNKFEKLQDVAIRIQETSIIQEAMRKERAGKVTYRGHSIDVNKSASLTKHISNVLQDMDLSFYKGTAFSNRVYTASFAKHISFLLAWLLSVKLSPKQRASEPVNVAIMATQMKVALKWLTSVMQRMHITADVSTEEMIAKLN